MIVSIVFDLFLDIWQSLYDHSYYADKDKELVTPRVESCYSAGLGVCGITAVTKVTQGYQGNLWLPR